jgi:hypothetical protein
MAHVGIDADIVRVNVVEEIGSNLLDKRGKKATADILGEGNLATGSIERLLDASRRLVRTNLGASEIDDGLANGALEVKSTLVNLGGGIGCADLDGGADLGRSGLGDDHRQDTGEPGENVRLAKGGGVELGANFQDGFRDGSDRGIGLDEGLSLIDDALAQTAGEGVPALSNTLVAMDLTDLSGAYFDLLADNLRRLLVLKGLKDLGNEREDRRLAKGSHMKRAADLVQNGINFGLGDIAGNLALHKLHDKLADGAGERIVLLFSSDNSRESEKRNDNEKSLDHFETQ